MADRELKLKISGEDNLSGALQKALENMANLHTGTLNLNAGLELLEKGFELVKGAWELLEGVMEKSIEEALEAEKANNRLNGSLIATGKYSAQAAHDLDEYVKALEASTGANGEAIKTMIATGIQLGLSVDKAKQMEQAARQLAAATGTTAEEAFSKLQASLAGNVRALGMAIPQVKELGAAQLKTGAAIDVVVAATKAQYDQYQSSLPAAIERTKNAYNDLYKALGLTITASPALQAAISTVSELFRTFGDFIEQNQEGMTKWVNDGVLLAIDALQGLNVMTDAAYRIGVIAFYGIKGAVEALALGIVTVVDGPFALLYKALSYLPGDAGRDFGKAADEIGAKMVEMGGAVNDSASKINEAMNGQTATSKLVEDSLLKVRDAAVGAMAGEKNLKDATEEASTAASDYNKNLLALTQTFAGLNIGNNESRKQLAAQAEDYKKSLADFQQYYDAKIQIAVDKETFQAEQIAKVRAESLKGTGGEQEKLASGDAAVQAETVKQQQLAEKRKLGILNEAQYQEALRASEQRQGEISIQMASAHQAALADALGESPAGFQIRQQTLQANFQEEQALKMAQAQEAGATQEQLNQMEIAGKEQMLATKEQLEETYYEKEAERRQRSGDQFGAFLSKMKADQVKEGAALGTLHSVQNSSYYKTEMGMLGNLASLRNSHSKEAFEVGKKAAIAQATVQTFMAATEAFASLASIPIVGPVLGAAAAAAAVAAGFVQIQNINAQQFSPGGQADQGMDAIPAALAGKSFVMSAGERVVQPEANKKLTAFLDQEMGDGKTPGNQSGRGGPTVVNITVTPGVSQADAQKAVDTMIVELRKASERGQPIISDKGIVYNNK